MMMKDLSENQKMLFTSQYDSAKKDAGTMLVLSILFGGFGVDRFMLGDMGMGLIKLLTFGGCGILTSSIGSPPRAVPTSTTARRPTRSSPPSR